MRGRVVRDSRCLVGSRIVRRLVVSLLLGLLHGDGAEANRGGSYKSGVEAIERGAWSEAVGLLEEAIAERPEARSGRPRSRYLPYYYLGIAHAGLGECAEALAVWETSLQQGMVNRHAELLADLQERRRRCVSRLELEAVARRAEQDLQRAAQLAAEVAELAESVPGAWAAGEPPLRERLEAAREVAAAGRAHLSSPSGSLSIEGGERAAAAAADALRRLSSLREELLGLRSRLREERQAAALEELERVVARARGLLRGGPGPKPLADLLREAESAKATAEAAQIDQLRRRLAAAVEQLAAAAPPAPPPASLLAAAEAYFGGDYRRALDILEGESYSQKGPRLQAALLRAGASFGLYLLDGERDESLLDEARRAVLDCRRIDPSLEPDPEAFSPRFVEFFSTPATR